MDGVRYTIFSVDDDDEMPLQKNSGFRRLNGGGVKWTQARLECRKRGQYLATVLSNEAAKKIAAIMLKNRPCEFSFVSKIFSPCPPNQLRTDESLRCRSSL